MAKSSFGGRLKRLREARGLSRQEFAERARLSVSLVGHYETGEVRNPSIDRAKRMAKVLGVSPTELLFGAQAAETSPDAA